MRNIVIAVAGLCFSFLAMSGTIHQRALARAEYSKQWRLRYAGNEAPAEFKKAVRKAGCKVCHLPDEKDDSAEDHERPVNGYGEALGQFLSEEDFEKYKEQKKGASRAAKKELLAALHARVVEAIEKAESLPVDPENAAGPTFGELFERHELP